MSVENVSINFTTTGLNSLRNAENTLTRINRSVKKFSSSMKATGRNLTLGLTVPIVGLIGKSVMLASDLKESMNVVSETFKDSSKSVISWAGTLNESYGLVKLEAMQYVGSMGAMMKSTGLSEKASEGMSKKLVELAGDMSSFYNLEHDEVWEKIRSGISGQTMPLKILGINMDVANLSAYALSQGINKSWKEMTSAEKTTIRYNYLMKVTKDAQGDFNRTQAEFANQLKILQGNLITLGEKIGAILLPYFNRGIKIVNSLVKQFEKLSTSSKKIVIVVGLIMAVLPPLIFVFGAFIGALSSIIGLITAVSIPVIAVVAGIGALIGVFALLILKTYSLKEIFAKVKEVIVVLGKNIMAIKPTITNLANNGFAILNQIINKAVEIFRVAIPIIKDLAINAFGKLKQFIQLVSTVIKDVLTIARPFFNQLLREATPIIKSLVVALGELARTLLNVVGEKLKALKSLWDNIFPKLKPIIVIVFEFIVDKIKYFLNLAKEIIKLITNIIKGNWSAVWENIKEIVYIAIVATAKTINSGISVIRELVFIGLNKVKQIFVDKWETIKSTVKKAVDYISDKIGWITGKLNKVKSLGGSIGNKIQDVGGFLNPFDNFATGTSYAPGGLALVGERGAELINLPRGSQVHTASETNEILTNRGEATKIINIYGTIPTTDKQNIINALRMAGV